MKFDMSNFRKEHGPRDIGPAIHFPERTWYCIRVLDMLVSSPDVPYLTNCVLLPSGPLTDYRPLIVQCLHDYGDHKGRYVYLTVDQGLVKAGMSQRHGGCHVDGFQGARINPKVEEDTTYVVSDVCPTEFFVQSWELDGLDLMKDNVFLHMDQQAKLHRMWAPGAKHVVRCSPYDVHRAAVPEKDTMRTFIRVAISVRRFDRKGNTINPSLDRLGAYADWSWHSRDLPKHLVGP